MVTFGNIDVTSEYGLTLSSKFIGTPSVKKQTIDIVGGNGVLDYTDYFGEPKLNNRILTFTFSKAESNSAFVELWSRIQSDLQGKKCQITYDVDGEFYYIGRIELTYTRDKNITSYIFTCDCEPFKYKNDKTVIVKTGNGNVILNNLRRKTVPTITTSAETTVVFGEHSGTFGIGTFVVPEFELSQGANNFTVTTTGTVTFTYQEGDI